MIRSRYDIRFVALPLLVAASAALFFSPLGAASSPRSIVPEGTVLALRMETYLSSKTASVGDRFTATVIRDVTVNSRVVIPVGSRVEGHVTSVQRARRLSRPGTIAVDFDRLVLPDGRIYRLYGELTPLDPKQRKKIEEESRVKGGSARKRTIVFIGGGAGVGAVIGAIAGGGKGAAAGAGVGAAIGAAGAILTKGREAVIEPGMEFGLELLERLDLSPSRGSSSNALSSPGMLRRAQRLLRELGYYDGPIDGLYGPRTHRALRDYQLDHDLPVTGRLDEPTARRLGLLSTSATSPPAKSRTIRVLSAYAERLSDQSVRIVVDTEAPTGGWQTYGEHSLVNDTIHVWVRGIPPTGPATQVITRSKVEVTVSYAPAAVRTVVVHGADRDLTITVAEASGARISRAASVGNKMDALLTRYLRAIDVRLIGDRLIFDADRDYTADEIDLLLSLHTLNQLAHGYLHVVSAITDDVVQRRAAQLLLDQVERVDQRFNRARIPKRNELIEEWRALEDDVRQIALTHGLELAQRRR